MQVLDLCKDWIVDYLIKLFGKLFRYILLFLTQFTIKEMPMNTFKILIENFLKIVIPVPA